MARDNRAVANLDEFKPLSVQVAQISTVIQLLYSEEPQILNDAIIALSRYAAKSPDNVNNLYNRNVLAPLIHLLYTTMKNAVLRFSLKLISMLLQISEVVDDLKKDKEFCLKIGSLLSESKDEIIHEFSASILAVVSVNKCTALNLQEFIPTIWQHIATRADLDLINFCLKTLSNLLDVDESVEILVSIPDFEILPLVDVFDSKYIEVQSNALKLIHKLAQKCEGTSFYELITAPSLPSRIFFDKLLAVLDKELFSGVHHLVTTIISEATKLEQVVLYILEMELLPQIMHFMENWTDCELRRLSLDIVRNIARIEVGRQELYMLYIDKFLLEMLMDQQLGLLACEPIYEMVKHPKAVKTFTDTETVRTIVGYLITRPSDLMEWIPERANVIEILTQLIWYDPKVPDFIVRDPNVFNIFLETLKTNATLIPTVYFTKFLYLFQAFALCKEWYNCVLQTELFDSLHEHLSNHRNELVRIVALNVLTVFMSDELAINWALTSQCYLTVLKCVKESKIIQLIHSAITFLNMLVKYEKIAYLLMEQQLITILEDRQKEFEYFPLWKQTLVHLYDLHLPSKFNRLDRLEFTDITDNCFYATKLPLAKLPILEDLIEQNLNPLKCIFVCNFVYKRPPAQKMQTLLADYQEVDQMIDDYIDKYVITRQLKQYKPCDFPKNNLLLEEEDIKETGKGKKPPAAKKITPSFKLTRRLQFREKDLQVTIPREDVFKEIAPRLLSWFGRLPPDPYLKKYLQEVRNIINANAFTLRRRIQFLAEFIVNCTSGPKEQLIFHLNEIKVKYGSNLIPIGLVRIGAQFERAILFKVLADRLFIPCTLVRGENGRAWNEVALIRNDEVCVDESESRSEVLYAIVDLMQSPGEIYPLQTKAAYSYCKT